MNFFFQRKLKKHIQNTSVPLREDFLPTLRSTLIESVEKDRSHSFFSSMKPYQRVMLPIIPLALCAAVFVVQSIVQTPARVHTLLSIPEVLAESIHNTFNLDNTSDFVHQHIVVDFKQDTSRLAIDSWRYQDQFRTRFADDDSGKATFEYLQTTTDTCVYTTISTSSFLDEDTPYIPVVECSSGIDVHYAPLIAGDLSLDAVRIEPALAGENVDGYFVWSSEQLLDPVAHMSYYASGYIDGGQYVEEVSSKDQDAHVYRIPLSVPRVGKTQPGGGDGEIQFVQIRSGHRVSAVFEVNIVDDVARMLSDAELASAQERYVQELRAYVLEVNSPQERYNDFFGIAIDLIDELSGLEPVQQVDELYHDHPVTRVRYTLPEDVQLQEEYLKIAHIEFVLDVQNQQILEYTIFDEDGKEIQKVSVESSEKVTDVEPSTFFSIDFWKHSIGVE